MSTDWTSMRLKWTVRRTTNGIWGDEADGGANDIACIRVADFDRTSFSVCADNLTIRSVAPAQRNSRILKRGNLLLEKSGGGEKQPVGAVVIFNHDFPAICSNFIARVDVADEHCPRYLVYLHAHLHHSRITTRSIKQTTGIQNLDEEMYLDEVVSIPDRMTQRAIADFLDRKTAAIDGLIEKKERLIALLAEKRTALIHQAVTKGLDPNVPMKDSGVPWIGQIPTHWIVHRLRRVVDYFIDYRGRTPEKSKEGVPLITAGAVRDGVIDHSRAPEWVSEDVYRHLVARGRPEPGDVLFTSEAPLGEVALVTDPRIACAQRIIMFKVDASRVDSGYLLYHFLSGSGKSEVSSRASGSTASGIRADRLKMSFVPTPPVQEQREIVDHIERETSAYSAMTSTISKQIEKLKEYRQSLITSAVTGKLPIPEKEPPS